MEVSPNISTFGDENAVMAPPPCLLLPQKSFLSSPLSPLSVSSASTLAQNERPKRKTRQTLRDLTNQTAAEVTSVKKSRPRRSRGGIGVTRKRKATGAAAAAKKTKTQSCDVALPPPHLERFSDLLMDEGKDQMGDMVEDRPPVLEKMVADDIDAIGTKVGTPQSPQTEGSVEVGELVVSLPASPSSYQNDLRGSARGLAVASSTTLGGLEMLEGLMLSYHEGGDTSTAASVPHNEGEGIVPLTMEAKKKKKPKGRNGNIYIGVSNRISWLKLQEAFGFDNINSFGNFIMGYMNKVYDDFEILHQVAVDVGIFENQGLTGFRWVNGLPHPVNTLGEFIELPIVTLSEEYRRRAFEVTYDLCLQRGKFLVDLAKDSVQTEEGEQHEQGVTESEEVDQEGEDDVDHNQEIISQQSSTSSTSQNVETTRENLDFEETSQKSEPNANPDLEETSHNPQTSEPKANPDSTVTDLDVGVVPELPQTPKNQLTVQVEFQLNGAPISLNLQLNNDDNKENIHPDPNMVTPTAATTATEAESVLANVNDKKNALRQILGDISLESICSPENFTPSDTPNSKLL